MKRQLEERSDKYNELLQKFEDRTRQIETMHIYAQRTQKSSADNPSHLSKSRSLQSLNEPTPRAREEKKTRPRPPPVQETPTKKPVPKSDSTDHKPSTTHNAPPKGKVPARRLSTPKSIDEEESKIDDVDDFFDSSPKKKPPPTTIERSEKHISHAQIHKRPLASNSSTTDHSSAGPSSIFKLTEPPPPISKSKPRATRDLDEKWSDMFGSNKQDDSAKDDLLARLVADEQKERKLAASTQPPPAQRPSMNMFESSTRSTSKFLFSSFRIRNLSSSTSNNNS